MKTSTTSSRDESPLVKRTRTSAESSPQTAPDLAAQVETGRLSPRSVVQLQSLIGNRATLQLLGRAGTPPTTSIQRYRQVASTGYTVTASPNPEAGNMFESQAVDPSINPQHEIGYQTTVYNAPPLLVSDDDTVAINDTHDEAKEFYATGTVVANANARLDEIGSPIRLDDTSSGNEITVNGNDLSKVRPKKSDHAIALLANEVADFVYHRCVFVANRIMGAQVTTGFTHEVLFQDQTVLGGGPLTKSTGKGTESDAPYAQGVAEQLLDNGTPSTPQKGKEGVEGAPPNEKLGEEYGRALGAGTLDNPAQQMGVNQFARAGVGEGYITSSVGAESGDKDDYSVLQPGNLPTQRGMTWGYHFAAVVAESEDGADQITLENYNRAIELKEAIDDLIQDLTTNFAGVVGGLVIPPDTKPTERAKLLLAAVYENAGETANEAQEHAKEAVAVEAGKLWYFKMFGSQVGQSFHDAQAASGYFANPLTMRVRPPVKTTPTVVLFAQKTATPVQTTLDRLLLPGVVNGIQADLRAYDDRRVKCVGYANNKAFGKSNTALAQRRADRIKQELVNAGVDGTRIDATVGGSGVDRPKVTGKSQAQSNRRVEVHVE